MAAGKTQTVLVVEDEASIASFVSLYLKNAGYSVRTASTGSEALTQVAADQPTLIVLDLNLPDIDGIEVCRRIRKSADVPILMLTARDEDVDKIIGLEVGADDYLTKPFNPRELVARVKSVLRRAAPDRKELESAQIRHGDLVVDAGRREVHVGEQEIQLAPKEFDLLWELLDHRGLVLTRDQLLERVWGYTFAGDTRTVDVHVRQLRRKLGDASPKSYALHRARSEVRREVTGLTQLYAFQATNTNVDLPSRTIERAIADRLFFVPRAPGIEVFPGSTQVPKLPSSVVDLARVRAGNTVVFEFRPPGSHTTYIGAAHPLVLGKTKNFWGALVVGKRKDLLQTRVAPLLGRLGLALLGGLLVSGLLAAYLSRRLTRPVLELSRIADEVARGNYDVDVPDVPGGSEIGHLADRFREMAERLHEAEQLERNFLMSVSHELRTPLTAIRGHVAALSEGLVEDAQARAVSLETIAAETERLARLVGDVLDLAKLDAHRFTLLEEEVDMEQLVARAYSTFNEEARRRDIDYRTDLRARPVIMSDGDRVLQIITNLLSNAFRWTPDGGRIELELESENGAVSVSVSDTGPGIVADERERIFRPFWSRDGGGTGLGLAIARELAQALGGDIAVETEVGKGSTFELVLPAGRPAA